MKFTITTNIPTLNSNIGFSAGEMIVIGTVVANGVKARTAEGRNIFDNEAKALTPRYKRQKVRKGGKPIRDLRLSGDMMAALDVLRASDNRCVVGVQGGALGQRAGFNQAIDPWLGIAPSGLPEFERVVDGFTQILARRVFRSAA